MDELKNNIGIVVKDKSDVIDLLLTALIAGGHILLEDSPGVGKTVLAKSLARSITAEFKRIQFTPDLLPADVTGSYIYSQKNNDFEFRSGPVFTNILLADEINRATPRTQSSLLEGMEERQVTSEGFTFSLPSPFFVIATQNPIEQQGTFPLPEAQLDRFMKNTGIGYPSFNGEMEILESQLEDHPLNSLTPVCGVDAIIAHQQNAKKIYTHKSIRRYTLEIARKTREHQDIIVGVSPRATVAMFKACQAYSYIMKQTFVSPETVKYLAPFVFGHRMVFKPQFRLKNKSAADVINEIILSIPLPAGIESEE